RASVACSVVLRLFHREMGGIQQQPWTPTKRRGPIAAEYSSPGPACVTLPNLIGSNVPDSKRGRAPAFSFGSRHGNKNDSPGPGPGQYNVTGLSAKGKDSPPAATLHSRPKDPRADMTPAPGDYNPEKSEKVVLDNSPKYTFWTENTGGEAQSDTRKKSIRAVIIGTDDFDHVFGIRGEEEFDRVYQRIQLEEQENRHKITEVQLLMVLLRPRKFFVLIKEMFSFKLKYVFLGTIQGKHSPFYDNLNPRLPVLYEKTVPQYRYQQEVNKKERKSLLLAAPNVYNIPTVLGQTKEGNKKQAPAFTISGRQKDQVDDRILTPGPGTYNDAKAENYKVKAPAYSISSRYQMPSDSTQKPGPGAHSPEKARLDNIQSHSFGIKHSPYIGYLKDTMC
ncbi:hypothetical protein L9F63_002990, partial [Diploptera punctata]